MDEEELFTVFDQGYGVSETNAREYARMLAPFAFSFNRPRLDDIIWAVVHWGQLTPKPSGMVNKGVREAIPWLTKPQGFMWAQEQASSFKYPKETERAQQAFMQQEMRRLGIDDSWNKEQFKREQFEREQERRKRILASETEKVHASYRDMVRQQGLQREAQAKEVRRQEFFGGLTPQLEAGLTSEFIEGVPVPAAKRFLRSELPRIFSEQGFEQKQRQFFEDRLNLQEELRDIGRQQAFGTPYEEFEREQDDKRTEIQQRLKETQSPWQRFLTSYPGLQKFEALTPRERGFQSRQFRPRARFL